MLITRIKHRRLTKHWCSRWTQELEEIHIFQTLFEAICTENKIIRKYETSPTNKNINSRRPPPTSPRTPQKHSSQPKMEVLVESTSRKDTWVRNKLKC